MHIKENEQWKQDCDKLIDEKNNSICLCIVLHSCAVFSWTFYVVDVFSRLGTDKYISLYYYKHHMRDITTESKVALT